MKNNIVWSSIVLALGVTGCPSNPVVETDSGVRTDAPMPVDAPIGTDAGMPDGGTVEVDAGSDAGTVDPDTGLPDGGMPLPPITDPTSHVVPVSAAGHDRLYGVVFAPDSSFYVVGVAADGTDSATNDFRTVVGHFDAAGDLDTDFGTGGWFERNLAVGLGGEIARGIGLQSDGSIVVAATTEHVATGADPRDRDVVVFRLDPTGSLDDTFGDAGFRLLDLSNGVAEPAPSTAYVADSSWNLVVEDDDDIVVAVGMVRSGATDSDFGLVRLTPDGDLDDTFSGDGIYSLDVMNVSCSIRDVALLPDGRLAGSGYFTNAGVVWPVIYEVDDTGAPVTTFGDGGLYTEQVLAAQAEVYSMALQGGSFVTAGYGRDDAPGDNDFISMRVDVDSGDRDLTYGGGDGVMVLTGYDFNDNAREAVLMPDGEVMMVGALRTSATTSDAAIVLLSADGEPDATFGTAGVMLQGLAGGTSDHYWSGAVDPRGERVVLVGIGGTDPTTDDDGVLYLFPVP